MQLEKNKTRKTETLMLIYIMTAVIKNSYFLTLMYLFRKKKSVFYMIIFGIFK